jgi:hypothetical protein
LATGSTSLNIGNGSASFVSLDAIVDGGVFHFTSINSIGMSNGLFNNISANEVTASNGLTLGLSTGGLTYNDAARLHRRWLHGVSSEVQASISVRLIRHQD